MDTFMRRVKFALAVTALVLFSVSLVHSKPVYVPGDAATIQAGIDIAEDYDTVMVLPGTYTENIFILDRVVSIISEAGPAETFLHPVDPDSPVLTVFKWTKSPGSAEDSPRAEFSGFTISGGGDSYTIDIDLFSRIIISNNIFHDNIPSKITDKSVIVCNGDSSAPIISKNVFYENYGITCVMIQAGEALVINNTFDGNSSAFLCSSDRASALNNIVINHELIAVDGVFLRLDYNNIWNNILDYG